jgi:hypothetical protein
MRVLFYSFFATLPLLKKVASKRKKALPKTCHEKLFFLKVSKVARLL